MSITEFWDFCEERESIRIKKEQGLPRPWTTDNILDRHKFTNINRQHDRGTVLLNNTINGMEDFEKIFAIIVYRFSGSLNNLLTVFSDNDSGLWSHELKHQTKLVNTTAYQANWGKGTGKGLQFVHTTAEVIAQKIYNVLPTQQWTIDELAQKICDFCNEEGYPRMYFQATESSKDLAEHFDFVDVNSVCNLGPGAIKGIKHVLPGIKKNDAMKQLLEHDRNTSNYNYAILEHALCEYSKWKDYKDGTRKPTNKIYTPTE